MSIAHLTEKEVAERLRVTPRALRKWRAEGNGPRCMGIGSDGKTIRYRLADIDDFELGRMTPTGLPPSAVHAITRAAQTFDVLLKWQMRDETRVLLEGQRDDLRALLAKPAKEA